LDYSLVLPVGSGGPADPSDLSKIADLAREAESLGFAALAFTEHPAPSSKWLNHGGHETLDPIVALAYCAASTTRIRLMPYLCVLPYRNPLLSAKSLATLDIVSGGRLTIVTGAGYLRSEFRALGVDFAERNELLDEALEVLSKLWAAPAFDYEGRHFQAVAQVSRPLPVQQPHPPIWIGGNSRRARERAARFGSGWSPMQLDEGIAATARTAHLATVEQLADAIAELHALLRSEGRTADGFSIQLEARATNFTGSPVTPQARRHQVSELASIGVSSCVVHVPTDASVSAGEVLRRLGDELMG
jgi:probable F420-dependent oxidoreductase